MKLGPNYENPDSRCTSCKRELNMTTPVDQDEGPRPGDISICFYCGHLLAFDENLQFRDLTDEEIIGIAGDPDMVEAQNALAKFNKAMKAGQV